MTASGFFKLLMASSIVLLIASCGGAPGSNTGSTRSSSGNTDSPPSPATVNLGDNIQSSEDAVVTLTATSSSTAGNIVSYNWTQLLNGSPQVTFTQTDGQISFTPPNVRQDTNFVFNVIVEDAEGNRASDAIIVEVIADTISIANMPMMYSEPPAVGDGFSLSIATTDKIGDIEWTIVSAPAGSQLTSINGSTSNIFITPDLAGEYVVQAQAAFDGTTLQTTFIAADEFGFLASDVRGANNTSSTFLLDIVENQAWISSSTLDRDAIVAVVDDFSGFNVVGYDEQLGLLVQFETGAAEALDGLEEIRLQPEIDNVSNRIFEGASVSRDEIIPNDGGAFDDLGNNWHLEYINAPNAWDITTGSANVAIGITDSGFNVEHADLTGRVFELLTNRTSDHGTQAVGAIGALSNNGMGITGLNWVSDMILAANNIDGMRGLFKLDSVAVINNAWAIPGHINASFDPLDPTAVNTRDAYAIDVTRSYRRLAQAELGRLFVWPAGNGIGNGSGNMNQIYGINARHHSGALHYDDKNNLVKQANVMFAAAVLPDNRLAYYSNWGESVDIAAPTSYQSTISTDAYHEADTFADGNTGYAGTSASTAVVSGVASLVYSLNPDFSGEQVKSILIDSADTYVTERYVSPISATVETLDTPIPIIDAERALNLAQEIINSGVDIGLTMPNPFSREVTVNITPLQTNLSVVSVDWTLASSVDGETNWVDFSDDTTALTNFSTALDAANRFHRLTAVITLQNADSGTQTIATKTAFISYNQVSITSVETVSLADVAGVNIVPDLIDAENFGVSGATNGSGQVTIYVAPGSYKIRGSVDGFEEAATRFTADGRTDLDILLVMSPADINNTGALSGFVKTESGAPVQDAVVRISGGTQTNGFFASSTTDANGYYVFSNLNKNSSSGSAITAFLVEASADDFSPSVIMNVGIVSGEDTTENLILLEQRPFDGIFSDDFEGPESPWLATGFWNRFDLMANDVANQAVDRGNTSLAPDEPGPRAWIPEAVDGAVVWWYGQASTGSFIGVNTSIAGSLTGGSSEGANEGTLTTPPISLATATTPFLRFRTWWEIESVNPNASGFDILDVQVSTDGGDNYSSLRRLNPFVDPNDTDRSHKGFTSAGFNRMPIWVTEEIDLTQYRGRTVQIRFSFDTRDAAYNGFRGWFIDDFVIGDYTLSEAGTSSSKPENTRFDEYLKLHKQPQIYSDATTSR